MRMYCVTLKQKPEFIMSNLSGVRYCSKNLDDYLFDIGVWSKIENIKGYKHKYINLSDLILYKLKNFKEVDNIIKNGNFSVSDRLFLRSAAYKLNQKNSYLLKL